MGARRRAGGWLRAPRLLIARAGRLIPLEAETRSADNTSRAPEAGFVDRLSDWRPDFWSIGGCLSQGLTPSRWMARAARSADSIAPWIQAW